MRCCATTRPTTRGCWSPPVPGLERDRRTETAAATLHIHPNALSYRLRRFGTLADRDLTSTGAPAEVWPAIQAAGALGLTD
ncbi:helix-turn-helix domain-containing protein [Streptomyces fagopyri]|uniref:helix-turn-helix domain-containing protein n=1 Tax=Streptomyces fagopyri TaxID=2662397 RepID=UPI00371E07AD